MVRTWLAVCVLALVSCRSFEFTSERAWLRHVPEEDAVDLVLCFEGVGAKKANEHMIRAVAERMTAIANGRRHFLLGDWPLDLDLDRFEHELRADPGEVEELIPGSSAEILSALAGISMEARLLVAEGEPGELCLLQRWRIEGASGLCRLLERFGNALVVSEIDPEDEDLEPREREQVRRWLDHAAGGKGWLRFEAGDLVVTVPMSAAEGADLLRRLDSRDEGEDWGRILRPLSGFTLADGVLELRFSPDENGWIRFSLESDYGYLPGVAARLVDDGVAGRAELDVALAELLSD